ncbi:MAG: ABC transporter permease [Candidatus Woesearchaeota archaeon]|nr:ABC transporter permease [Candidatus Woesearchaeota archaeon]
MAVKKAFDYLKSLRPDDKLKKELNIIWEFTIQDFKLKYKNSVIGYFWSLLNPLLMLLTLYVVFSVIMKLEIPYYQLFLLLGIILWNFISEATNTSIDSILSKGNIIRSLFLNLVVFSVFMIAFRVKLGIASLLFPLYLFELAILVCGISFILCGVYVKFRDIKHIWNFLLLLLFWLSPIVYPESRIPIAYRKWYMLNPLARLINGSRDSLIYSYLPEVKQVLITSIICIAVLLIGVRIFRRFTPKIAEEI